MAPKKGECQKVKEGYSIAIFPEGTRTYDGRMKRFHKGAFYLSEKLQLDNGSEERRVPYPVIGNQDQFGSQCQ